MSEAARVLRSLLAASSDSVKLAAARSLLELGSKIRDNLVIEQRLAEVERRLAQKGARP